MPELPEVETVRRGLVPRLVGHRIVRLIQRRRDLRVPLPGKFAQKVEGRTVQAIDRRAKYLLIRLDDGQTLIAHLGMSGRMTLHDAAERRRASLPAPRPCRARNRRRLAGSFQRRSAVRLDAPGAVRNRAKAQALQRTWARAPRRDLRRPCPRRASSGKTNAYKSGTARSEDTCRHRQYLRLRGAVSVRHLASAARPIPCKASGQSGWWRR